MSKGIYPRLTDMIVKMRQITILVKKEDTDSALSILRETGLMHVTYLRRPHADYIDRAKKRLFRIDKVLGLIGESNKQETLNKEELVSIPKGIIGLAQERIRLKERLAKLEIISGWYKEWGDISKADLKKIADSNIFLRLYICRRKDFQKIKKDKMIYIVGQKGKSFYIAHITRDPKEALDFSAGARKVEVPQENSRLLNAEINYIQRKLNEIEDSLSRFSIFRNCFSEYKKRLLKTLEFIKVKFGMASDEALAWLQGYCPAGSASALKKLANKEGWGIAIAKPVNPDKVPTLLKNPRWVETIKPVFNFMGTLPGYKEYDISFWFLMFFSLFFAMIVGDAGYGFIFLAATYLLRRKFKKVPPEPFFLFYLLSSATIIWGAVSGTWFGAEAIARIPFFNFLIIERINSFVQANQNFMIYFCFIIGVVHLSIAHLIKAFRYLNSFKALSEVGWVCILWAAFFVAGKLVLNRPIPAFILPIGVAGMAAVILFSNFQKNILKGALSSLGNLPLDIVSSFSDIVSYLRLFAVGYATVAVGSAFNQMAVGAGLGSFGRGLIAAFVLFLGHGLNILLCLMSVIVHGIRLNMLEFSGQLGMEWSGVEYKPFK